MDFSFNGFHLLKVDDMNVVLVVMDRFSKYAVFVAAPSVCKIKVAMKLFYRNMVKYLLVLDRHCWFWTTLFNMMGTQLKFSTANHPQTYGQTERINALLEEQVIGGIRVPCRKTLTRDKVDHRNLVGARTSDNEGVKICVEMFGSFAKTGLQVDNLACGIAKEMGIASCVTWGVAYERCNRAGSQSLFSIVETQAGPWCESWIGSKMESTDNILNTNEDKTKRLYICDHGLWQWEYLMARCFKLRIDRISRIDSSVRLAIRQQWLINVGLTRV
uniref:Integrase catalytic domain-containing protein n=1 Tax=Salix viminalis TaxID=40686 RepID=A0A6N2LZ43_SALVM